MSQIQAIIGCAVHLRDFANIELFVQGYYQIRVYFSTSLYPLIRAKLTVKSVVESANGAASDGPMPVRGCVHPDNESVACSAVMRILYKLEEVRLNDTFVFELTTAVNPGQILADFENLGLCMFAELWFSEKGTDPLAINSMHLLCTRKYSIVFDPRVGVDTSVPVMFDCFHLCLVRLTLHCSLLAIVPLPAPTNSLTAAKQQQGSSNFSALFEWEIGEPEMPDITEERKKRAFSIYKTICELLLVARESLLKRSEAMSKLVNKDIHGDSGSAIAELVSSQPKRGDWRETFQIVITLFEDQCDNMEAAEGVAHQQITRCSAQNILIWNCFLDKIAFNNQVIADLARQQMYRRLLRFSECFFYKECERDKVLNVTLDAHNDLFDLVQKSAYSSQPFPLIVECADLDGTSATLPMIIEERYCSSSPATTTDSSVQKHRHSTGAKAFTTSETPRKPGISPSKAACCLGNGSTITSWTSKRSSLLRPLTTGGEWYESGIRLVSFRKIDADRPGVTMSEPAVVESAGSSSSCLPITKQLWPLRKRRTRAKRSALHLSSSACALSAQAFTCYLDSEYDGLDNMHARSGKPCIQRKSKSFTEELFRENYRNGFVGKRSLSYPLIPCDSGTRLNDRQSQDVECGQMAEVERILPYGRSEMLPPSRGSVVLSMTKSLPNLLPSEEGRCADNYVISDPLRKRKAGRLSAYRQSTDAATSLPCCEEKVKTEQRYLTDSLLKDCCFYTGKLRRFYEYKSRFLHERFRQNSNLLEQYRLYGSHLIITTDDCLATHISSARNTPQSIVPNGRELLDSDSECGSQMSVDSNTSRAKWAKSNSIAGNLAAAYAGINDAAYDYIDGQCYSLNTSGSLVDSTLPVHLIVCVHGLDGDCNDLRLFRTFLYLCQPKNVRVEFLMSSWNHNTTFGDFDVMVTNLFAEIVHFIERKRLKTSKISFIGHSMGNVIIRALVGSERFAPFVPMLHTFLSLGGPHLGMLFGTHGIINIGLWIMQKWKKSTSLLQLAFKDKPDIKQTFMYRLSKKPCFQYFKNVLLVASPQDHYAPFHSARIEPCKSALKDNIFGSVYVEMVSNLLAPILKNSSTNFVRYTTYHPSSSTTNELMGGRSAHIAALDSEIFVEKLVRVSIAKYFF